MFRSTMYGTPPVMLMHSIREASASGDLERMKAIVQRAEEFFKNPGKWLEDADDFSADLSAALEALKLEIAKLDNQESQE